jgi:hypothetical protein
MAIFEAYSPHVEVFGQTVGCFIYGIPGYEAYMAELLQRNGIPDLQPDHWYPQQLWLNAFREVSKNFGPNTLFTLGKSIPSHAAFRLEFTDLEAALQAVDKVFQLNHRNGYTGCYRLSEFDALNKEAVMECKSPYPPDFERGVLVGMVRKYKPAAGAVAKVEPLPGRQLDEEGEEVRRFRIKW